MKTHMRAILSEREAERAFRAARMFADDPTKLLLSDAQEALAEIRHAACMADEGASKDEILERLWDNLIKPEEK